MLLITYDISNNKLRASFSKFLKKFGERLQYSVFEIENSERILANIEVEIKNNYAAKFCESDSIMVFNIGQTSKRMLFGYPRHQNEDVLIIS